MVSIAVEASELADCGLDRLGENILVNCEIVEVGDADCASGNMDDDVRPVDSDIAEADDEGTALSTCELDSAGIGVAEWVNSVLIEDDEVSVLSNRELDRRTDNDVFALGGKFGESGLPVTVGVTVLLTGVPRGDDKSSVVA